MKLNYIYAAIIIYFIASYFHVGYVHADEYYQIFQFAAYKIGLKVMETPWEFTAQMRSSLQPTIIVLIYKVYALFDTPNPFAIGFIMRLFSSALALISSIIFIKAFLPTIDTQKYKEWFILLTLLTWAIIYYNIHYCSENISGKFFIIGFSLLFINFKKTYLKYIISGLFLGIAFTSRFQTAFLIIGLFAWLIFINKIKPKDFIILTLSIIITIAVTNVLLDKWFYGSWAITAWNYFKENIVLNKVNNYGEEPWYYYIYMTATILPFGPFYVIGTILMLIYRPTNVFTWILLTFIVGHSLIGHKELRFMVPILSIMPLCIIYCLEILETRFNYNIANSWPKTIKFIWYTNCFLFVVLLLPPTTELPVWRYIYNSYKTPTVYYFLSYGGSDIDFYKNQQNLESVKIDNVNQIKCDETKKCLLGLTCMQAQQNTLPATAKIVYSQCPTWLYKFNFSNWIGRTAIYNVYELDYKILLNHPDK